MCRYGGTGYGCPWMCTPSPQPIPRTTPTGAASSRPLKDRYGAQIRTHYPRDLRDEIAIMEQERCTFDNEKDISYPALHEGDSC